MIPKLVGAVWLMFIAKAAFYASFLPTWEGYDEYAHFGVVQAMAARMHLTTPQENGTHELGESLRVAPVSWMQSQGAPGLLTYEEFWRLPEPERARRELELRAMPWDWSREPAEPRLLLYEGQQPPLAYWLMSIPYRAMAGTSLPDRVWLLRMTGVLLASFAIPIGFWIARQIFGDDRWVLAAIVVAAALPEPMIDFVRVSNEPLALLLATLYVAILVRIVKQPDMRGTLALGVVMGAALLTKAYFLALIPATLVAYAVPWWRRASPRGAIARQAFLAIAIAAAISGWWYARNVALTGSLTGEFDDIASLHRDASLASTMIHVNWARVIDSAAISHIWLGGWSFLVVRSWMYRIVEAAFLLALVGLMRNGMRPGVLIALIAPQLFFWCGLAYHALATFRNLGISGTFGYYACCLTIPEAICLIVGLRAVIPSARAWLIAPALALCFSAIEFFGVFFYLMPYYTGFTAHTPVGGVPALHLSQLSNGGLAELFRRLAWGKPEWITPSVLIVLFAVFVAAQLQAVGLVAIMKRMAREVSNS